MSSIERYDVIDIDVIPSQGKTMERGKIPDNGAWETPISSVGTFIQLRSCAFNFNTLPPAPNNSATHFQGM